MADVIFGSSPLLLTLKVLRNLFSKSLSNWFYSTIRMHCKLIMCEIIPYYLEYTCLLQVERVKITLKVISLSRCFIFVCLFPTVTDHTSTIPVFLYYFSILSLHFLIYIPFKLFTIWWFIIITILWGIISPYYFSCWLSSLYLLSDLIVISISLSYFYD